MSKEFEELLEQYWDLAYLEGKTGQLQGDKANEVLHALRLLAEQPAQYSDIVSDGGMDPRNKFDKPATPHNWSVGMSAQDVVQTLLMVGWKQVEIAEEIQLKQPNISRVASGQQDVRWQHMDVLRSLLDQAPPRSRNA